MSFHAHVGSGSQSASYVKYVNCNISPFLYLIFFPFFLCRAVKMPAVQKTVKKVASRCSTHGKKSSNDMPVERNTAKEKSAEENTVKEESEVKPLRVCKKLPKNRDGEPVLTAAMKPPKFYPGKKKLPTARHGKPFRCGAG